MVQVKVRKVGNSLGVVLPKDVVSRLGTEDGGVLYLAEIPGEGYRLTPFDPSFEEKMSRAEDIMSRYRNALHILAR